MIAHGLSGLELFRHVNRKRRRFQAIAHIQHLIAGEIYALFKHGLLLLDGVPRNFGRLLALRLEYALTRSDVDNFLVPSRFTAQELALVYHQPPSKIAVLPNAVDTNVFHPRLDFGGTDIGRSPDRSQRNKSILRGRRRKDGWSEVLRAGLPGWET